MQVSNRKLSELISDVQIIKSYYPKDLEISGLAFDSRNIKPQEMFFAIPGTDDDGEKYIDHALKKGASIVVTQSEYYQSKYPYLIVKDIRQDMSLIANHYYQNPSESFYLAGVTGTNGKTTTTSLVDYLWREKKYRVGLLGTIKNQLGDDVLPATHTTPDAISLQKIFSSLKENQINRVVIEVSSHALSQKRVDYSNFDSVLFTNLSQDHLDYHQTMEDYFQAKLRLFTEVLMESKKNNRLAIINLDNQWGLKLLAEIKDLSYQKISFGFNDQADFKVVSFQNSILGITAKIKIFDKNYEINFPLIGKHNLENLLGALAIIFHSGENLNSVIPLLEKFPGVEGRLQRIDNHLGFHVFVDYAHTPDAIYHALTTLKALTKGRLMVVFGCGGDRDRTKRPLMGKIATELAEVVLITSDNPRTEDPQKIIEDITKGISFNKVIIEPDRKKAIEMILNEAKKDDVILIAGKGHEDYQIIGKEKYYFSDQEVVRNFLKK